MCDITYYENIYNELKTLTPDKISEIVFSSDDIELRDFYICIGNYLLQKKQKELIREGVF